MRKEIEKSKNRKISKSEILLRFATAEQVRDQRSEIRDPPSFTLIHKAPQDPQPGDQPGGGVVGGGEVIIIELESTEQAGSIEVLESQVSPEAPDTEMNETMNIGEIGDTHRILVKKLPQYR